VSGLELDLHFVSYDDRITAPKAHLEAAMMAEKWAWFFGFQIGHVKLALLFPKRLEHQLLHLSFVIPKVP
jgi:hypothetical protein